MFKKILMFTALFAVCAMTQAQRQRINIKTFTGSESVSAENVEKVRAAVISAVNASQRFDLLDDAAWASIEEELVRRSSEEAVNDAEARKALIAIKANNFLMTGNVASLEIKKEEKEGKIFYAATLNYSVSVTDVAGNKTVATKSFSRETTNVSVGGGSIAGLADAVLNNDTPEKAVNEVLTTIDGDIKKFFEEEFPLLATIYGEDFEIKKDKLVQCYISIGTNSGVFNGQMFDIFEVKIKVGKETKSKIGSLKIVQADEDIALGKVTKGDKEVKLAMDRYLENKAVDENATPLIVISRPKKDPLGLGGMAKGLGL